MAKLTLTDLVSLSNETAVVAAINNNNTAIETALENTLSRDGTTPNSMSAQLDMNTFAIINIPAASVAGEPVEYTQWRDAFDTIDDALDEVAAAIVTVTNLVTTAQTAAANSLSSSLASAASAAAAVISAAAAASSLAAFKSQYLGSAASNPLVDGNGSALTTGDLYFNSSTNQMFVYTGSTWIAAVAGITASSTDTFTNKTINLTSNTLTGTTAQFNTALSDDNFAVLGAANTFTAQQIVAQGSIAASAPSTLTQTWSTTGTYTGILENITDSGPSNAASLLMDLQVGGSSKASITKAGTLNSVGVTSTSNIIASVGNIIALSDAGLFKIGASQDVILARDGANILGQRNGTTAQQHAIYKTYTDASNFSRLLIDVGNTTAFGDSNAAVTSIYTDQLGTGGSQALRIGTKGSASLQFIGAGTIKWTMAAGGTITAATDNSYDIGASGATRPRNLYIGTDGFFGGNVLLGGTTSTSSATPNILSLGGTFADAATSDKAKLKIYQDGTASNTFGFGVSAGSFDFFSQATVPFNFRFNNTSAAQLLSTKFFPTTNDGVALGDTTHNFSDLFLATGAVINFNNSNVVLTHSSGILTLGTGDLQITTAGTNAASVVTVGGTQTLTAKTLTSPTMTTPVLGTPTSGTLDNCTTNTETTGNSTSQLASTAFVQQELNKTVINTQTASYTAVLTDAGATVEINNASANTFTIPPNSSVAFPIGTFINVTQYGAGQTTLTPGLAVTIRSKNGLKMTGQYAVATLYKRATDEWVAGGDTST